MSIWFMSTWSTKLETEHNSFKTRAKKRPEPFFFFVLAGIASAFRESPSL